ncbi:MAG TPA: 4-hydroxy-tetrahydrodipicolinate synthase [Candidatus Kapabacteria bacterium]|nr:4-hydroxy-tetrahydrodipicolinate synthase [Candidatus Kapabacteria bacterium]HOM04662.1 4-hydroxy-tetrahydrodipicolinate synthase [Candidatus Kapabacteria bacterium]HPP39602.1 4-hydroxy-tetrahydrodipicolinate synthase [Candidatus Kapabacteria bacterium]
MEKNFLLGTTTAIVTPFKSDLTIDFDRFKRLLDFQMENGVKNICVCGSTGESATMTAKEKVSLIVAAVEHVGKDATIIAGTGSNDTRATIDLTILAKEAGADAALLVAPYYNKPSQEGLFQHYAAIAENVDLPLIIYNVPSRAGVNISAETQIKLAKSYKNIVATKEASGDLDQISEIIKYSPGKFIVLAGDDSLAVPTILFGGKGVVSVISNYAPKFFSQMVNLALDGDYESAMNIHYDLLDLFALNFIETNPIPVKAALVLMGMIEEYYRLPLIPMRPENKKLLQKALKKHKLVK